MRQSKEIERGSTAEDPSDRGLDRQRIDKWLWHARMVRTRGAAASLAESGHVRVNGQRIVAASRTVRVGDVVLVALDRTVRVLKVVGLSERRGSFELAKALYQDLVGSGAKSDDDPRGNPRQGEA
ncbi:MAG: RNA-binding S4 domain-containing protein [Xanthobacteraceae bacterium]